MNETVNMEIKHAAQDTDKELRKFVNKSPYKASYFEQFRAVLKRSFLSMLKEPTLMQARIVLTVVSIYLKFKSVEFSISSQKHLLYLCTSVVVYQSAGTMVRPSTTISTIHKQLCQFSRSDIL